MFVKRYEPDEKLSPPIISLQESSLLLEDNNPYTSLVSGPQNDKFPSAPAFIFAIDVSYNAMKSGYVELLCRQLHTLLDTLPKEANQEHSCIKVGFFTYSNVLHFYNLNVSSAGVWISWFCCDWTV